MSLVYIFIKLYPIFGISLGVLCLDLARNYKRRARRIWVGFALFATMFFLSTLLWFIYRGDINSEVWFNFAVQLMK